MASAGGLDDTDDGGPRRQPELSETFTFSPEPEHPASDLALLDEDDAPLPAEHADNRADGGADDCSCLSLPWPR